jgi:hypothetical protein
MFLIADFGDIKIEDSNITSSKKSSGGRIEIAAKNICIDGNTKIDVSNSEDGGQVYIGGGKQGKDLAITNAVTNFIGKKVVIDASSKENGNGGEVICWATDSTHFFGKIFADGGITKGNGGFAEVSGLKNLIYDGVTDLRAGFGNIGTLLLDPLNFNIVNAGVENILKPAVIQIQLPRELAELIF